MNIPKPKKRHASKINPSNINTGIRNKKICFSFETVERNEYFNLDATCQNWASDLFEALKKASGISMGEVWSGKYSGKHTPFRIHSHKEAKPPCPLPKDIELEDYYQIRVSLSKGGIHGIFVDNIFYIIWFDPQHNMYPSDNHGGLKKIIPPDSCCKDRELMIDELQRELISTREELEDYKKIFNEL